MAAKYIDTITDRAGNALAGASVQVVDQGGALVTLYSDPDLLVPIGTSASADYNGLIQFYVPDGTYTIRQSYAGTATSIQNVELFSLSDIKGAADQIAATKANAAAIGVAPNASNLGTTPGTILSDNGTAKQWFQESEAAIEGVDAAASDALALAASKVDASGALAAAVGVSDSQAPSRSTLASGSGASLVGASITDADSIGITMLEWLRDQVILPRQFGVVGDGVTDDTAAMVKFFAAIKAGKKGYLPAGCWPKITALINGVFSNGQHFYLEGAGADVCGILCSGTLAPFIRFNYANIFNSVHFRNLTMAVNSATDASACISLLGVGHGAPGSASQNDFTDVVWRGWDGRIQTHYWGNCLYTKLVNNVMIRGGGAWGPNHIDGKGDQFIFLGDAADPNPYAVHFDFDTVYLAQFRRAITLGTYGQGLTLKAVNGNRGDYGVYIGAGQVANDIITIGGGSQFNCNVASIGCFEDEATLSISDTTFVLERTNGVGIRTASRWGRFRGNHFQGIGAPSGAAGIHYIDGADRNIATENIFSTLGLGLLYDAGTSANLQALNRFDGVTTSHVDNGTGNIIGVISV